MLSKPLRGRRVNQRHWSAKGLVGAWLFNEGCGTKAFDSSGHGNHGTLIDMASPPTSASGWGAGRRGGILRFDGTNDYVNCGAGSSLNVDAVTVEVWLNPALTGGGPWPMIVTKQRWDSPTDRGGFYMVLSNDGTGGFTIVNDANGGSATISGVTANQWVHLVGTYDPNTDLVVIYKNGELIDDTSYTADIGEHATTNMTISSSWDKINAAIAEVNIYNRALSADEIVWLYRNEYAMFTPLFSPGILYIPITARSYGYIF